MPGSKVELTPYRQAKVYQLRAARNRKGVRSCKPIICLLAVALVVPTVALAQPDAPPAKHRRDPRRRPWIRRYRVSGRRTTLEFLPAVWLFGANNDYVGQTLETNPMFQLDVHLTRDFTEHFWGSFDTA